MNPTDKNQTQQENNHEYAEIFAFALTSTLCPDMEAASEMIIHFSDMAERSPEWKSFDDLAKITYFVRCAFERGAAAAFKTLLPIMDINMLPEVKIPAE